MQPKFTKHITIASLSIILNYSSQAQSIINFDDVTINSEKNSYSEGLPYTDSWDKYEEYLITSNKQIFKGKVSSYGFADGFDVSKGTDTINSFPNDKSAITGKGYDNSDNYAIAYLTSNWPDNPNESLPLGLKLFTDYENQWIKGAYFTNTTYAYREILKNIDNISFLNIIVKGYNKGIESKDSVSINLYKKDADITINNTWTWTDLSKLNRVDSITFYMKSDYDMIPFYFAMDNIIFDDNSCFYDSYNITYKEIHENIVVASLSAPEATISEWEYVLVKNDDPISSGTIVKSNTSDIILKDLESNTFYTFYYRNRCDEFTTTEWYKSSFTTATLGINNNTLTDINIYPNPTKDILNIKNINNKAIEYSIYDITGKKMLHGKENIINCSSLIPGIYTIVISNNEGTKSLIFNKL